jgi:hypothetical protein
MFLGGLVYPGCNREIKYCNFHISQGWEDVITDVHRIICCKAFAGPNFRNTVGQKQWNECLLLKKPPEINFLCPHGKISFYILLLKREKLL